MNEQTITASLQTLFTQSKYTAEDYLSHSCNHLDRCDFKGLKFEDYMRFAELMAYDFRSSLLLLGMQHLEDSINNVANNLERSYENTSN